MPAAGGAQRAAALRIHGLAQSLSLERGLLPVSAAAAGAVARALPPAAPDRRSSHSRASTSPAAAATSDPAGRGAAHQRARFSGCSLAAAAAPASVGLGARGGRSLRPAATHQTTARCSLSPSGGFSQEAPALQQVAESPAGGAGGASSNTGLTEGHGHGAPAEQKGPMLWYPKRAPGTLPNHVTFYKRVLPAPAVAFSSVEGKRLWKEAILAGTADCYFKLSEQFTTQMEPAYCGLTSLTMVLNALEIDPRRTWKGVWRWFVEDMLDCCTPLVDVASKGVTFQQVANLAQCNGAVTEKLPFGTFDLQQFRDMVTETSAQSERFMIVSYSRSALNQSGDGHFSPVGGYNKEADMVLILDVARFKYPPHWVPLTELYVAMSHVDQETGRPRGVLILSRHEHVDSTLFSFDVGNPAWRLGHQFVTARLPAMAAACVGQAASLRTGSCGVAFNLGHILASMASSIPDDVINAIALKQQPGCSVLGSHPGCSRHEASEQLLKELRALPLFKAVFSRVGDGPQLKAERVVMLLLAAPASTWDQVPTQYRAGLKEMLNPSSGKWALKLVATEVEFLCMQMAELLQMDASGKPVGCLTRGGDTQAAQDLYSRSPLFRLQRRGCHVYAASPPGSRPTPHRRNGP